MVNSQREDGPYEKDESAERDGSSAGKNPLFSVIIPTYNAAHLLGATIDSVLTQSFQDFEVIVVDDGATDSTPEVLQSYGERISVIRQENCGAEAARHNGAALARGAYLVLLDHDDLLLGDALATYARVIRSGEMPALVIAQVCMFSDGEPTPAPTIAAERIELLRYANYFGRDRPIVKRTCSQLVIRRTVAEATQALRPRPTAFPLDSSDILLALGAAGPCCAILHPTTVAYRSHAGNSSGDLERMVRMAPRLLNLVRTNDYHSEQPHRLARYANAGGIQLHLFRESLRADRFDLACRVMWDSWPMFIAATVRYSELRFRPKVPVETILLTEPPV